MKKAKIMLSVIAVVAAVGAGLAFKSKNFGNSLFTASSSGATSCTAVTGFTSTVNNSLPEVYVGTSASSCPDYKYFTQDGL